MSNEQNHHDDEIEYFGEPGITSKDAPVPNWLKFFYITLPIWGIIWLMLYWNGSWGWLDRGYWSQLQQVANTKFPVRNYMDPSGN